MNNAIKLFVLVFFFSFFIIGKNTLQASGNSFTTGINSTLSINAAEGLLRNYTNLKGENFKLISYKVNNINYSAGQTAIIDEGSITLNADGSFIYNPAEDFNGSLPVVVFTISNGKTTIDENLFLSVFNSEPPSAQDDYDTADINTTLDVPAPGVIANDTFEDESTITVISFTINGRNYNIGETAYFDQGDVTIKADGSYIFEPFADFTGNVPEITYTISDGTETSSARLFLTVQRVDDLIQLRGFNSCNQGYGTDGNYKIQYSFSFKNLSTARDSHPSSLIENIDLTKDFDAIYGSGCVIQVDNVNITMPEVLNFRTNTPYPKEFVNTSVNPDFQNATSNQLFNAASINNTVLYPRQEVFVTFCVIVDPNCGGRTVPTPSGSGINFESELEITSSKGSDTSKLNLTDFHTTEAIITGGLSIPDNNPEANPDGTYDYTNSVFISNDGNSTAENVNFNMGLGNFLNNQLSFRTLTISQVSGPRVTLNENYNGDTNTKLLESGNSLNAGEIIELKIYHLLEPVRSSQNNTFPQLNRSQTQGTADGGIDENTPENSRQYSYVTWEDGLGKHLDRYYSASTAERLNNDQCECVSASMSFSFISSASSEKNITNINKTPGGILEHEEVTFQLIVKNTSPIVDLYDLKLQDDLLAICEKEPVSITPPQIVSSTASVDPILNSNYDGVTDIDILDDPSWILMANESVTIEFTVVFIEDCIGANELSFSGIDPLDDEVTAPIASVDVNAFTDSDNDGISNVIDIDDDNDTILDVDEYDGVDPLGDHDGDLIPNYRDTDFGPDENNDGIVDSFDFDGDGVPNHFDLDSDNDGIFDVREVGNSDVDTNSNGQTNNEVGENGLDNTVETNDESDAEVTYSIPYTDLDLNPDYKDIDSDDDGIVDNIEAQPTNNYIPPNNEIDENGVDTAYTSGLIPVDTDEDGNADYIDLNSDDDIRDDYIEGWDFDDDGIPETEFLGEDVDNDGLDDAYDRDITKVNPTNGQVPTDFPNANNSSTPERDWRELMAIVVLIDDITVVEGNDLVFTISLVRFDDNSVPIIQATPIELTIFTTNGTDTTNIYNTAISPNDYGGVNNVNIIIPPFTNTYTFTITSVDDNIHELDELFTLNAVATSNNIFIPVATGIGTLLDNDAIPNLFSPNDDGRSDTFRVDGLEKFPNFKMVIFDRWGSEIYNYSNNGKLNPEWWDGTFNGKPVIEGVYFYTIDYNNGFTKPKTGFIQLIR